MMMQSGLDDTTKLRMLQAKALSKEARGGESRYIELTRMYIILGSKITHILVYILRRQLVCISTHIQTATVCDHSHICQM